MKKFLFLFLLPFLLLAQELEVHLATKANVKPLYMNQIAGSDYAQMLRGVLEYDLNTNGLCAILPVREDFEKKLRSPDVKKNFDLTFWKKEKIPFCLAIYSDGSVLQLTAFNIEHGSSKKYPEMAIKGDPVLDRQTVHRLADLVQKDLFGKEGIHAMRLIYTKRVAKQNGWISEIWMCDSDGANAFQVTTDNSYCLSPSFAKSRSDEFFYVSEKSGQSKIYKASLLNPAGKMVVDLRGNQALASLSKGGNKIAFISDVAGRPDLFVQNIDALGQAIGKAVQIFSAPQATQASPTFSPDSKQIAFVSDKDGTPRVYVLPAIEGKTKTPKLLTRKNRENTSPAWSPDGSKLAYSAKIEGVRQIWIYDFATDEETPLTLGPNNKENPAWAPDSLHLVYNTESDAECELYVINLLQGEPIQITHGTGQKRFASWQQW